MRDFIYIDDNETFRWLAVELSARPRIAVDTEANGLHAYHERMCLVQISTEDADFIVDPLAIDDLSPLVALLTDPAIEKIFHAAEFDLILLRREYDVYLSNLFDTMVAAQLLGHKAIGLNTMLEHYFDVHVDKGHQRDNWAARPLPADSLRYAQADTYYLPQLRDVMYDELKDMGRLEEAAELMVAHADVDVPVSSRFDPEGYWKLGRPLRLRGEQMAVLRELYILRDEIAQGRDVPPFKILPNRTLTGVAAAQPRNYRQLEQVREVSSRHLRQYGDQMMRAVERASVDTLPDPPELPTPPDPDIADRYTIFQQWRKHTGQARNVSSDIVMPKATLWQLAREMPRDRETLATIEGIGPVRLSLYADDLLTLIHDMNGSGA